MSSHAQEPHDHDHAHEESAHGSNHDHHHDHRSEIGVAGSAVYLSHETATTFGMHVHYTRALGESPFVLGVGYEHLFDDHNHQTFTLVAGYRFTDKWSVHVAPGLVTEGGDFSEVRPGLHVETLYEFALGDWHLGPLLEWAIEEEGYHVSLGVHLGIGL